MFSKAMIDGLKKTPDSLVNSRKFDVALRQGHIVNLLNDIKQDVSTLRSNCLLNHVTSDTILSASRTTDLWPIVLGDILHEGRTRISKEYIDRTKHIIKLMSDNMRLQHYHLNKQNYSANINHVHEAFENWNNRSLNIPEELSVLTGLERELILAVEKQGSLTHRLRNKQNRNNPELLKKLTKYEFRIIPLTVYWSTRVSLFHYKSKYWILPTEYLTMMHNKVSDIISIIILVQGSSGSCYEENALDIVMDIIRHLTTLAVTQKGFFEIVKAFEGIITGEIIASEENWSNTELIDSICEELEKHGYLYQNSYLQELIQLASTPLKTEIAGLSKICGHPFIDMEATAEAAQERAIASKTLNYIAIQATRNLAVESFIRNYIVRHGMWPPVKFHELTPEYLTRARDLNKDPKSDIICKSYGGGSADDYVYVELEPVMEFNKLEHYSQYLKDKAISVLRNEAHAYYITQTIGRLDWKETRLLLVHLFHSEEEMDLQGYLEQYINDTIHMDDVLNYLTIKLVPKEKELKIIGRPFGCKTYKDRFRSCLQEENVKQFLDLYCDDQSMTLDHLGLTKRLYSFRHLTKMYKDWRVLYINFDVSGWCANFRHETVEPVCSDVLDKIYDTETFFSKTQMAYEKGYFYIPDPSGSYHWVGQDGGIEGLNQYTWMTVYVHQMRYALNEFQLHFFVMAYGDDYKAALLIPPNEKDIDLKQLKTRVVTSVAKTAIEDFGQKMKYFDSYGSEVFVSFCKQSSVSGSEMPQGIRKIQKCYGATNAFLPTLDDYVASAFSNAHAAARVMTTTYAPYRVALFWTYLHLLDHYLYESCTDAQLHAHSLIPSCVGGLPILFLANFHTRAENDHLPFFLDLIEYTSVYSPEIHEQLKKGLSFNTLDLSSIETLLRDPYSLPVEKPPLPGGVLRREIMPALKPLIRNSEVLTLLAAAEEDWTEMIIKCLGSSEILYPRVLSSIYSCTPKAMIEEIVKRFETSASVKDILVLRKGQRYTTRVLRKVLNAELDLQQWRVSRIGLDNLDNHWECGRCPASLADSLRSLWGKPVGGVTMPPMTHLMIGVDPAIGTADKFSRDNHFTYYVKSAAQVLKHGAETHWSLGEQRPFLGHRTRLGSELPQLKIIENNPFLSKIKTLLDIISWVDKGDVKPSGEAYKSNLPKLVRSLISQYYKGDPDELMALGAKRKSGTLQHHWRSPHYNEHIMPNSLSNTYTWVTGESNTHRKFRNSAEHFSVNFLQIYCHMVHLTQMSLEFAPHLIGGDCLWGVTIDCSYCMTPIKEPPIVVDESLIPPVKVFDLEGLDITDHSRRILVQAAEELKGRLLKPNIDLSTIPTDMAVMGVAQRLSEQTHMRLQQISDKVGIHHRTLHDAEHMEPWVLGGFGVTVREREIKHAPIQILAECILQLVSLHLYKMGPRHQQKTIVSRLMLTNPRDLPWVCLVEMIHQAGQLPYLVQEVRRVSGLIAPVCYDNPITAARYIGDAAITCDLIGNYPVRLTRCSYYEETTIETYIEGIGRLLKARLLWKTIRPLLVQLINLQGDENDIRTLYASCFVLMSAETITNQELDVILMQQRGYVSDVRLIKLQTVTLDNIVELEEDNSSLIAEATTMLSRVHGLTIKAIPIDYDVIQDFLVEAQDFLKNEMEKYGSCRILDSTLADCINKVRSVPISPHRYKGAMTGTAHAQIGFRQPPPLGDAHYGFRARGCDPPRQEVGVIVNHVDMIDSKEVYVDSYPIYRPFSRGMSSLNKWLEVCYITGLDTRTLSSKNIMCLGEGQGGLLDAIASLGTESHFMYNSMPQSTRFDSTPGVALPTLEDRSHTLDDDLVNSSVYDLSKVETAAAIITNDTLMYHLITCDVEVASSQSPDYALILYNVVGIYLQKRTIDGVLVCKIYLSEVRLTATIITMLAAYSNIVEIHSLRSSGITSECYIIARGTRKAFEGVLNTAIPISPVFRRRVSTLANRLSERWKLITPPLDCRLECSPNHLTPWFRRFKNIFPPAWEYALIGKNGLLLKLNSEDWTDADSIEEALIREIKLVRASAGQIYEKLEENVSAAGVIQAALKYLYVVSCEMYLVTFAHKDRCTIDHGRIRRDYLSILHLFLPRVNIMALPDKFSRSLMINGVCVSPYEIWIKGFNTVMQFKSWLWL